MRLFVAVNLPARDQVRVHKAASPLRDAGLPIRWMEPGGIHLTLKFLGEVRASDVAEVERAVARAAAKSRPFRVLMEGVGAFPTPRRPRVIWLGVEATPELRCLKQDVEWEIAPLGFDRETRGFQPHLTLGRATPEAAAGDFRDFEAVVSKVRFSGVLNVNSVELMRSTLSGKGAIHEVVRSVPLTAPVRGTRNGDLAVGGAG
jgi:RNA 2',3'-cyclic 3'-phosphodiesterase